jgi:hypothetical protein
MRPRWHHTGPILAVVGGLLFWVGALMPWATTTVDPQDLATALAADPRDAPAIADLIDATYTWIEGVDAAAWMMIFATLAIVLALILLVRDHRLIAAIVGSLGVVVGVASIVTAVDPAALAAQIQTDADLLGGSANWAEIPIAESVIVDPGAGTPVRIVGAALIVLGAILAVVIPYRDPPADPTYVSWAKRDPDPAL